VHLARRFQRQVPAQPCGGIGFAEAAFGRGQIDRMQLQIARVQPGAVEDDERFAKHGGDAPVAVSNCAASSGSKVVTCAS